MTLLDTHSLKSEVPHSCPQPRMITDGYPFPHLDVGTASQEESESPGLTGTDLQKCCLLALHWSKGQREVHSQPGFCAQRGASRHVRGHHYLYGWEEKAALHWCMATGVIQSGECHSSGKWLPHVACLAQVWLIPGTSYPKRLYPHKSDSVDSWEI